jgi:hypothetical protein
MITKYSVAVGEIPLEIKSMTLGFNFTAEPRYAQHSLVLRSDPYESLITFGTSQKSAIPESEGPLHGFISNVFTPTPKKYLTKHAGLI